MPGVPRQSVIKQFPGKRRAAPGRTGGERPKRAQQMNSRRKLRRPRLSRCGRRKPRAGSSPWLEKEGRELGAPGCRGGGREEHHELPARARSRRPGGARVSSPAFPGRQGTGLASGRPAGPLAVAVPLPRYAARFVRRLAAPSSPRTGGAPAEVTGRGCLPLTTPAPSRHGSAAPSTLASCPSATFLTPYSPPPAAPRPHVLPSRSALPSLPASSSRRSILGLTQARELPGPRRPPAGVGRTPGSTTLGRPWSSSPGRTRGAPRRAPRPGEGRLPYQAYAAGWGGKPRRVIPGGDPVTLARWSWGTLL